MEIRRERYYIYMENAKRHSDEHRWKKKTFHIKKRGQDLLYRIPLIKGKRAASTNIEISFKIMSLKLSNALLAHLRNLKKKGQASFKLSNSESE